MVFFFRPATSHPVANCLFSKIVLRSFPGALPEYRAFRQANQLRTRTILDQPIVLFYTALPSEHWEVVILKHLVGGHTQMV
jgi:hypothetical protein